MNPEGSSRVTYGPTGFTVHLPVLESEVLCCPPCVVRRYKGARKVENLLRHFKQEHGGVSVTFACSSCGYTAPTEKKYPRKVVQQHCSTCVPDARAVRSGREDTARRQNIQRELLSAPTEDATTRPRRRRVLHSGDERGSGSAAGQRPAIETTRAPGRRVCGPASGRSQPVAANEDVATSSTPPAAPSPRFAESAEPVDGSGSPERQPATSTESALHNTAAARSSANPPSQPAQALASEVAPSPEDRQSSSPGSAEQRRLKRELDSITQPEQLEAVLPRVMTHLGRFTRTPRQHGQRHEERTPELPDRVEQAKRIQRLYRNKRKTAVQRVLAGSDDPCRIDLATTEIHFRELAASRTGEQEWPDVFDRDPPTPESDEHLCSLFGEGEVLSCLKRRANSAPGPDGITYTDLRRADPGARILTALFNVILRTETIPASWGHSKTILLHKKGDRSDITNWRPISLGDTTPKQFAAVVSERIRRWGVANRRFSASQKEFLNYEGCFEHNFVLSEVIRGARNRGEELVVAWLDLASAFNSVPHSSIFRALAGHGVPMRLRNVVSSLYTGLHTSVRVADGVTPPIRLESGVRQGCPLSPDIFNLTLEVLIRTIDNTGEGFTLEGQRFTTFFYADDGAIVSNSVEGMKRLLEAAERGARYLGITFNAKKCATLHLSGGDEGQVQNTTFTLQGTRIPALASGDAYNHLGIPTGYQVRQTPIKTLRDLLDDAKKISESLLAPWQKLDAVGTFLLPRLDFIMQGGNVEKEYLRAADREITRLAKDWLYLPQRASAELVYLPPSKGGGGLLPLADLYDILTVAHSYRLLYAGDASVRSLAEALLGGTVSNRLKREAGGDDMARYLTGDLEMPPSGTRTSFWAGVRRATIRLRNKLGLRWLWHPAEKVFSIACGDGGENDKSAFPSQKRGVANLLRRGLVHHYCTRLLAKRDQGKVYEVVGKQPASNHFLRNGSFTRFCDWRFIHRARLNVLPLNAAYRGPDTVDRRCRRCGAPLESLPHVLCHCGTHAAARQRRHNNIQSRLVKAARCAGSIAANRTVSGIRGDLANLRPDVVVRDDVTRRINIIDVCVPFENRAEALRLARQRKLDKYQALADELRRQGYRVKVQAFVVGALGAWDSRNEAVLDSLGVSRRYAGMMRRLMVSDTIRWSRDMYVEHVSGMRQYQIDAR